MKTWIYIVILFILISIAFYIGFYQGLDYGFREGQRQSIENCGFTYDPFTQTYSIDHTKINFTVNNT